MIDQRTIIMLPIAIIACGLATGEILRRGYLSLAHRRPITDRVVVVALRLAVGASIYLMLVFASPPPPTTNTTVVVVAMLIVWCACQVTVWYLADRTDWRGSEGPRVGQAVMQSEIEIDEEDEDDWIIEPVAAEPGEVDGLIYGYAAGAGADGMRGPERDGNREGAGADGSGALREPGSTGASAGVASPGVGGSSGGASAGGRTGGDGTGERTGASGGSAGRNAARNGMVVYPAVAGAHHNPVRRGRGRRLAGALVSGQSAPGGSAGASTDGYDAATATAVASAASTA